MSDRHIPVASVAAVEALADANGTAVVRADGYASTTLPDATYFYAAQRRRVVRSVQAERVGA